MTLGVGDLAAKFIPHLRQRMPIVLVFDCNGHCAAPALRAGNHAIELLELLSRKFDDVADLLLHLQRRGARIGSNNEGVFDREFRIFQTRQVQIGPDPQDDHEDGKDECDRLIPNRRLSYVHGGVRDCSLASAAPSSRPTKSGHRR